MEVRNGLQRGNTIHISKQAANTWSFGYTKSGSEFARVIRYIRESNPTGRLDFVWRSRAGPDLGMKMLPEKKNAKHICGAFIVYKLMYYVRVPLLSYRLIGSCKLALIVAETANSHPPSPHHLFLRRKCL